MIVADGFSGKTQIADSGVGRDALHTAQVMKLARPGPDAEVEQMPQPSTIRRAARVAAALGGLAAAGGLAAGRSRSALST